MNILLRNGLKIRRKKFRGGSSPPARTNPLLVRLLTDEDQERFTSIAHDKVFASSMRAIPLPFGGIVGASDQHDFSRFMQCVTSFMLRSDRGSPH